MKIKLFLFISAILVLFTLSGCTKNFGDDKAFLLKNTDAVVLTDASGNSQLVVVPEYQGRVMTSTANGDKGASFGWVNYKLIASKKLVPHMNTFGGEDRFWMGPEGGQFGLYFPPKASFNVENWQVPAPFDTVKYPVVSQNKTSVTFAKKLTLQNYSATIFSVKLVRKIKLLNPEKSAHVLGVKIPDGVKIAGYKVNNKITNIGKNTWTKKTGLLSIWILGNYKPSEGTEIILPINRGPETKLGKKVDIYASFGKIPADRLVVTDNVILFKADGKRRGKVGLPPQRAKNILGSYDATKNVLTIVKYNKPKNVTAYVNSLWEIQKYPYKGDVVNAYNDGPLGKGLKPLGPFYEIETSSPALALKPNQSYTHVRYTFHFSGNKKDLNTLAEQLLSVSLSEVIQANKK